MDKFSASDAKQNFGELLARVHQQSPVGIVKHGKLVAALVPPQWLEALPLLDERRRARYEQRQVEQARLMAHQSIGIALLSDAKQRNKLLKAARAAVARWEREQLCSRDYIDRWTAWLALPEGQLVKSMCSDADGWGNAMRQNSPFTALLR